MAVFRIAVALLIAVAGTTYQCDAFSPLQKLSATNGQLRRYSYAGPSSSSLAMSTTPTTFDFDVAIIGCGVGGHGAALHARGQSLSTAVFSGGDVGGTCVNRGCVPSKALLAASGRVRDMKAESHLKDMGIRVEGTVEFDREGIAAHAKNLANRVKGNLESSLIGLGVTVIEGRGILTGNPHEIKDSVTGKVYTAKVSHTTHSTKNHASSCRCQPTCLILTYHHTNPYSITHRTYYSHQDPSRSSHPASKLMKRLSTHQTAPSNCNLFPSGSLLSDPDTLDWNSPTCTRHSDPKLHSSRRWTTSCPPLIAKLRSKPSDC